MFNLRHTLMGGAAVCAVVAAATPALAEVQSFDIPAQPARTAIQEFGRQSGLQILASQADVGDQKVHALKGEYEPREALRRLLLATNLRIASDDGRTVTLAPQWGSAAGDGADAGTVQALIVTAQKKEEAIQDVPIAISAFTQKALEEQKIEGGFDLLKAIPNVTFSKNNFTSYNFSIRGIGTKAVSATTDPGVAVSFNNASLIQNRLFEQEYFDVERVEVLRGPQGTLYGRNATAGVINVISAKPDMDEFKGWVKGEVGNYDSKRISAMVNVPLIEDKLAIRFAGAMTDRQGYDYNDTTKHAVNGRDLWSGRLTIGFNPTDRIRTSLVWERFNEDDNRSRTGKQLCKRDPGLEQVGDALLGFGPKSREVAAGVSTSQGCLPVSLYDNTAFETPNGLSIPFVGGVIAMGADYSFGECGCSIIGLNIGFDKPLNEGGIATTIIRPEDPYGKMLQSRDLRVINSIRNPIYRAQADVLQLNLEVDLTDALQLTSQTTYDKDDVYSFQDYNRFNTLPIINDTSKLFFFDGGPSPWKNLAPGGRFCDPQIGCSNSIAGFDISSASSEQWLQELRLQSDYHGPVNFSAGVNYTKFDVLVDYYVLFNLLSAFAQMPPFNNAFSPTVVSPERCNLDARGFPLDPQTGERFDFPNGSPESGCPYIDPNPLESIDGEGHNYFRSKNPYKLSSYAGFGEVYWQFREDLKVTAGLRYTDDTKIFTLVPSQLLLGSGWQAGGDVNRGYPEAGKVKQHWGEFTGRLGVDWKPELSFTEQTMLYAFYSRGYKGGGANPPGVAFTKRTLREVTGLDFAPDVRFVNDTAENVPPTFKPEFVNAFEVGAKNTLLDGALIFNTDAFFYDYKDYQVSKIVSRSANNENFDAKVWGLELETVFAPSRSLRLVGNVGYLDTAIGSGAQSIDVMNRTQGHTDWIVVKPWLQLPSNCIAPVWVVEPVVQATGFARSDLCGVNGISAIFNNPPPTDPRTGQPYDPTLYPDVNGGAGFAQKLKGNELPNSPHWTANLGAQYGFDFAEGWRATIRGDAYWQSQSWARVYNAVNDKLHGWYNANLSLWIENDDGLKIELYAKNLLDKTPITDAFINSDDTALTTNVFVLDPRLIGLSVRKEF